MGTPRPHSGGARVSNRRANRLLAKTRRRRLGATGASPRKEARSHLRKPHRTAATEVSPTPLDEAAIVQIADIPDEAQIEQAAGHLSPAQRRTFARLRERLAEQLGSAAAARLWLVTACPRFATTPLAAIASGRLKVVLAALESLSSPGRRGS